MLGAIIAVFQSAHTMTNDEQSELDYLPIFEGELPFSNHTLESLTHLLVAAAKEEPPTDMTYLSTTHCQVIFRRGDDYIHVAIYEGIVKLVDHTSKHIVLPFEEFIKQYFNYPIDIQFTYEFFNQVLDQYFLRLADYEDIIRIFLTKSPNSELSLQSFGPNISSSISIRRAREVTHSEDIVLTVFSPPQITERDEDGIDRRLQYPDEMLRKLSQNPYLYFRASDLFTNVHSSSIDLYAFTMSRILTYHPQVFHELYITSLHYQPVGNFSYELELMNGEELFVIQMDVNTILPRIIIPVESTTSDIGRKFIISSGSPDIAKRIQTSIISEDDLMASKNLLICREYFRFKFLASCVQISSIPGFFKTLIDLVPDVDFVCYEDINGILEKRFLRIKRGGNQLIVSDKAGNKTINIFKDPDSVFDRIPINTSHTGQLIKLKSYYINTKYIQTIINTTDHIGHLRTHLEMQFEKEKQIQK